MKIDVTKIMNGRADTIGFEYDLNADEVESDIILPEDFTPPIPVHVKGEVKDRNNCMSLTCTVTANYVTFCDRCLDEVKGEVSFELDETVSTSEMPESAGDDPTLDDVVFVKESAIDIDPVIVEQLALELPPYHLCSEDCPGLCPKCGKMLKNGPCGCTEEKETDPRLKILQKLLDNFD